MNRYWRVVASNLTIHARWIGLAFAGRSGGASQPGVTISISN
jgi:hypothetical protein